MRLLAEFVLLGMIQGQDVKAMVKSISEASGAPPSSEVAAAVEDATDDGGEGNVDQEALQAGLYPKYNVQDANMVVGFAKAAALEVAGYVPRTVREAMDALQKEIDQSRLQTKKQQSADAAAGDQDGALDTAVSGDAAVQADEVVDEDEYSVVSVPLHRKAIDAIEVARRRRRHRNAMVRLPRPVRDVGHVGPHHRAELGLLQHHRVHPGAGL